MIGAFFDFESCRLCNWSVDLELRMRSPVQQQSRRDSRRSHCDDFFSLAFEFVDEGVIDKRLARTYSTVQEILSWMCIVCDIVDSSHYLIEDGPLSVVELSQHHFAPKSLLLPNIFVVFSHLSFDQLVDEMEIRNRQGKIFHRLVVET